MALVLAACGGGDDDDAASPTTTTAKPSTTTTEAAETTTTTDVLAKDHVAITAECPGIGPAPEAGEITWVQDGKLWAASPTDGAKRCLLETRGADNLAWGGTGDRVLAGQHTVVLTDGPRELGESTEQLQSWSRPTGRALIAQRQNGELTKVSVDDEPLVELYAAETTEAAYHPAGLSIVMVVPTGDRPDLLMTSNLGENARWIVENENAKAIHDLAFTASGALVFIADHDHGQHVHQLPLDSEAPELANLYEPPDGETLGALAVSPWHDNWYAVGADCSGHASLHVVIESQIADVPADIAGAEPIGWMPDGGLFVLDHPDGCDAPGDLYGLMDGQATLLSHGVDRAAVRAILPPPPPPPKEIEAAPA
jgi:hypothetical protein